MHRALCLALLIAGCGTSARPSGPRVTSTVPDDGAVDVPLLPDIAVTFSSPMDEETVTAALSGTACTGSIQVSEDDFITCVAFAAAPQSDDERTFLVRPALPLDAVEGYSLRVTRDARSSKGYRLEGAFEMDAGFTTVDAPAVLSTFPADDAVAVDTSALSITFTREMAPATITTQTSTNTCIGTIQVSTDDFATCLDMLAAPASGDGITFTVIPAGGLASATTHRFRVTGDAEDLDGNPTGQAFESPNGFLTRYLHTIVIDGVNDFVTANERFDTSSSGSGYYAYLAWDRDTLFVGVEGADIGSASATRFVLVYLGGTAGTTAGQTYNTQSPLLPFDALWHVRWKADNTLTDAQTWDGMAWVTAPWNATAFQSGTYLELSIPLAELGSPATLPVHVSMINEQGGAEATFSVAPATSIAADGVDPDYAEHFLLDLAGSTLPSAHLPE